VDRALPAPSRPTRSTRSEKLDLLKPAQPLSSRTVSKVANGSPLKTTSKNSKPKDTLNTNPIAFQERRRQTFMEDALPSSKETIVVRRKRDSTLKEAEGSPVPTKRRRLSTLIPDDSLISQKNQLESQHSIADVKLLSASDISRSRPTSQMPPPEAIPSVAPLSRIKRIKLVVRRPPPTLTNPRHIPPSSKFNRSLNTFLNSYITNLEGRDVDEKALEKQASIDIALLKRVDEFKKQGRFIHGADIFFGAGAVNALESPSDERKTMTHWDHIMAEASERRKHMLRTGNSQQLAAQVATKVKAYWDAQASKQGRLRIQEEKKLRALAKATIKMVTSEWKKAVFVGPYSSFLVQQCFILSLVYS
jgi:helicase SWR1